MRLLVLHSRLSGYFIGCLRELSNKTGGRILIFSSNKDPNAPYVFPNTQKFLCIVSRDEKSLEEMTAIVEDFRPQIVMMNGWADSVYRSLAKRLSKAGIPIVMGFDNQWKGSIKQRIGALLMPILFRSFVDIIWVPGERQKWFAQKMGFSSSKCWSGVYTCDNDLFRISESDVSAEHKRFLFVGRYVKVKGLEVLLNAYASYRDKCEDPWELHCVGAGPLKSMLSGRDGVVDHGFQQPENLPSIMKESSVYLLPSNHEPWAVAVHEATCMGLAVICSDSVGAGVHLVRDYCNGLVFETGDADGLSKKMLHMSQLDDSSLVEYKMNSLRLSKQYSLSNWANTFYSGFQELRKNKSG